MLGPTGSVIVERHGSPNGSVVVVTIDRRSRRNAVDHEALLALLDVQREVSTDARARVLVITGAPPAFCAGADLHGVDEAEFGAALGAVVRGFGTLSVPVIAAIDGPAIGAGAQLAVAADLRIATPHSPIGVPAAKLGLAVDHWTVQRVASEFTAPVARAMLLGAEIYTAERLYEIGAVHRLGNLADALAWADELAQLAPLTIAAHKVALEHFSAEPPIVDAVEAARLAAWSSDDAVEGRSAFLEKRPARFTGA
jgi:enoyl-CoA hydratase